MYFLSLQLTAPFWQWVPIQTQVPPGDRPYSDDTVKLKCETVGR